jgi:hypothetical protein
MFSGTEIIKIFAMIYEHVVQQTVGIAVDTNFIPLLAVWFLNSYEAKLMEVYTPL